MTTERERLIEALTGSKEYRDAFWEENIAAGIAFQVREMRANRGWTQQELGDRAGNMAQERIHYIENPDYGRWSVTTLKRLASAFDVALIVRFAPYGELVDWTMNLNPERLAPPSFDAEFGAYGVTTPPRKEDSTSDHLADQVEEFLWSADPQAWPVKTGENQYAKAA